MIKKWAKRLIKITFWAAALVAVFVTILANMAGSGPNLHHATESMITENTPYVATIRNFGQMKFFPSIGVEFDDLELRPKALNGDPVVLADRVRFFASFWDVLTRRGRFKVLEISGLNAQAGALTPKALYLEYVRILDELEDGKARLEVKGFLEQEALLFTFGMTREGKPGKALYGFGQERDFELKLGSLSAKGILRNDLDRKLRLDDLVLMDGAQTVLKANLLIRPLADDLLALEGEVDLPEHGTKIIPALRFDLDHRPLAASGAFEAEALHMDDFKVGSNLNKFLNNLQSLTGQKLDITALYKSGDMTAPQDLEEALSLLENE